MTQLQQFLFELSFGQTRKIREYMLKRYNVYCGSMKDLEQAINDYIPNEGYIRRAVRSIGMTGESCAGEWPRENGISGSTPLAGANTKFTVI